MVRSHTIVTRTRLAPMSRPHAETPPPHWKPLEAAEKFLRIIVGTRESDSNSIVIAILNWESTPQVARMARVQLIKGSQIKAG